MTPTFVCTECGASAPEPGTCPDDGHALQLAEDPLLGIEVARYRLARLLGRGGMGRVYLGVQPEIGSRVAIKVLAEDLSSDPDQLERFFAEARAVNLIRHEGIVNVLDLDRLPNGRPYIVMEHLAGATLRDLLERGPTPIGGVVQALIEVLLALDAAHAVGIIHRDLKPDNVIIGETGHAKVLDFGIAKLSRASGPRTVSGLALGTPHYMAPEQITGGEIDARTDVYAAGCMLYEALTGQRPFDGETDYQLMNAHVSEEPRAPRALRPDLPEALEQIILQALAKRPRDRFTTARAMARALRHVLVALPDSQRRSLVAAWLPPPAAASIDLPAQRAPGPGTDRDAIPTVNDRGAPTRRTPASDADVATRAERPSGRRTDGGAPRRRGVARWLTGVVAGGISLAAAIAITVAGSGSAPAPAVATGALHDAAPVASHDAAPADVAVASLPPPSLDAGPDAVATVSLPPPSLDVAQRSAPVDARRPDPTRRTLVSESKPPASESKPDPVVAVAASPAPTPGVEEKRATQITKRLDYDPTRLDVSGYLATAEAHARELSPGARLEAIEALAVGDNGRSDLTSDGDNGWAKYTFVSTTPPCGVSVNVMPSRLHVWQTSSKCAPARPAPRCTVNQIYLRGQAAGYVFAHERVRIAWRRGHWTIAPDGGGNEELDDDCRKPLPAFRPRPAPVPLSRSALDAARRSPRMIERPFPDVTGFEPRRYAATAQALARELEADAELIEVLASAVAADGTIQGSRRFTFRSEKAHASADPGRLRCITVSVQPMGRPIVRAQRATHSGCTRGRTVRAPTCTLAAVLAQVPAGERPERASITWDARGWIVWAPGSRRRRFDDCRAGASTP